MNNGVQLSKREIEIIAGLTAGFSTTIVTHPLDLIKIRLQLSPEVNKKPFQSLLNIIKNISDGATQDFRNYKSNNIILKDYRLPHLIHQYYRGITPNLIGNISVWSLYFTLYAEFKNLIKTPLPTLNYFTSSALAGVACSILTNPIWVLKTRFLGTSRNERNAYKSIADGVVQILRNEGILGFWKGTIPSMFSVLQGSLQFTFYDHSKNYLVQMQNNQQRNLTTYEYIYASAFSKILSMTIMYPTQVVKARLQNYNLKNEKRTIIDVIQKIWNNEGRWRGFYKGLGANMIRVVPATCITFVVYESVKKQLSKIQQEN